MTPRVPKPTASTAKISKFSITPTFEEVRSTLYTDAMGRHSTDSDLDDNERSVLERREEHDWFVNVIAEDELGPGFAYSFGLYERFKHPEIIIFGLPADTMQTLINELGENIREGVHYGAGDSANELLEGYTCTFREVNPLRYTETFTWATWFYGSQSFPALQLFWPDKQGRFPWGFGFTESLRLRQPDLSESAALG